jgi:hypothetical protein
LIPSIHHSIDQKQRIDQTPEYRTLRFSPSSDDARCLPPISAAFCKRMTVARRLQSAVRCCAGSACIPRCCRVGANTIERHWPRRGAGRPHVSDDNPYSEAQFKTLEYRSDFPARFGSIEDARAHCQVFFRWRCDPDDGLCRSSAPLQGPRTQTTGGPNGRLDQSTEQGNRHPRNRHPSLAKFLTPCVSKSLTRSEDAPRPCYVA